ncbi:MAG: hypothetical protein AB8G95_19300 [Anaerolineae bacterium]
MYELKAEYGEQMEFVFVNIDEPESQPDMEKFQFRSGTPHLLLFDKNGEVVRQWFGTFTREQVEVMFPTALN